jgi:hypothetical protein
VYETMDLIYFPWSLSSTLYVDLFPISLQIILSEEDCHL